MRLDNQKRRRDEGQAHGLTEEPHGAAGFETLRNLAHVPCRVRRRCGAKRHHLRERGEVYPVTERMQEIQMLSCESHGFMDGQTTLEVERNRCLQGLAP